MSGKKRYAFSEAKDYRDFLEIKHLRTKNHLVLVALATYMVLSGVYLLLAHYPGMTILKLMLGFFVVLGMNVASLAYGKESPHFYEINKHITTLGVFSLSVAMIFVFRAPASIPLLFLAYAICAVYQDIKVLLVSNLYMIFTVTMIIIGFPGYLDLIDGSIESILGLVFFFFVFVLMLTGSSFIIAKQKRFFYNQIALQKELEYRHLDLLMDTGKTYADEHRVLNLAMYYEKTGEMLAAFADRIGIEDPFAEKIALLKDLETVDSYEEAVKNHPDLTEQEWHRLNDLLIGKHGKIKKIALKIAHTIDVDVKKREIFSETYYKTLQHQSDSFETRVVAFAIFYALLRKGSNVIRPLSDEEIYDYLVNTDFYYLVDRRVMNVYERDHDVFEAIIEEAFGKGGDA